MDIGAKFLIDEYMASVGIILFIPNIWILNYPQLLQPVSVFIIVAQQKWHTITQIFSIYQFQLLNSCWLFRPTLAATLILLLLTNVLHGVHLSGDKMYNAR